MGTDPSRRTFIKQVGVASAAAMSRGDASATPPLDAIFDSRDDGLPPHRPLSVPGLHAYSLAESVAPTEALQLCVSSDVAYDLSIRRLGPDVDHPRSDDVLLRCSDQPACRRPIHPGSYILIRRCIAGPLDALSLECWVRPYEIGRRQGLIGQLDLTANRGWGLALDEAGRVAFHTESASAPWGLFSPGGLLRRDQWQHIVGTWDGQRRRLFVNGVQVGEDRAAGRPLRANGPLRIGAAAVDGLADAFLDGDMAMPAAYGRSLTPQEVLARYRDQGLTIAAGPQLLGCWPMTEERDSAVADVSGQQRHGRLINRATWMIGGPGFNADVPRYGRYEPREDPTRGHGLRFASDDLYDCRWPVTHEWTVPPDARSGVYVARFDYSWEGRPRVYHVTFLVRPPRRAARAKLVVVAATTTWRAYNGTPFAVTPDVLKQVWDTGGLTPDAAGLPAYCLYRQHAAGQGTYQVGLRIPWPAAGPYVLYSGVTEYSHLMRADRYALAWLDREGYVYDLIGGVDLHADPSILQRYKVCVVVGHNEYWSQPMYQGVEEYLGQGGRLVVLSGNTMGWRVSFNEEMTVMECRKVDAGGAQVAEGRRGEAWHSHDGLRGGAQRECGIPGYQLVGVDILGWNHPSNSKTFGPYVVEKEDHFLFNEPEKVGLANGDKFGWAGPASMPMANGHEIDVRPSTFARLQQQASPAGAALPADPEGIVRLANGILPWREGGSASDYFFRSIEPDCDQGAEMIYWERRDGGLVFNAASIGASWTLHVDASMSALMRNVLHHFGAKRQTS